MAQSANPVPPPGDFIREELKARRWTQADLATILKRPLPTVNRILQGKHGIMPEMAIALAQVFGTDPELWLDRESRYRLSLADEVDPEIRRRAMLYELAPINDLRKRGWIDSNGDIDRTQADVLDLLQMSQVDDEPQISAATRKSNAADVALTTAQRAWCFRSLQLASSLDAKPFSARRMSACQTAIRKLSGEPASAAEVPAVLANFGVRFVVVEHLTGTKIDGATLWLSSREPVISMSLRYDRIDYFWFTLMHELSHVVHRDDLSLDAEPDEERTDTKKTKNSKPGFELRADQEAMELLVPQKDLKAFIRKSKPDFTADEISQFADSIGVHPGIVVGQLQHRRAIAYRAHRSMLVKVRDIVTDAALTDGWGRSAAGQR